jgi:hypothetical protein
MSLLIQTETLTDCEIGVYANDELVGSGVVVDGVCGISVWGDDATTPEVDGALVNESLELRIFVEGESQALQFKTLSGDGRYEVDGFLVVELLNIFETPQEFQIVSTFPNPFNSTIKITYSLPHQDHVLVQVVNQLGQRITTLFNGTQNAGIHSMIMDAGSLPSGLYFVDLESAGKSHTRKMLLVK